MVFCFKYSSKEGLFGFLPQRSSHLARQDLLASLWYRRNRWWTQPQVDWLLTVSCVTFVIQGMWSLKRVQIFNMTKCSTDWSPRLLVQFWTWSCTYHEDHTPFCISFQFYSGGGMASLCLIQMWYLCSLSAGEWNMRGCPWMLHTRRLPPMQGNSSWLQWFECFSDHIPRSIPGRHVNELESQMHASAACKFFKCKWMQCHCWLIFWW